MMIWQDRNMSECFKVFQKCFMWDYMYIRWLINWSKFLAFIEQSSCAFGWINKDVIRLLYFSIYIYIYIYTYMCVCVCGTHWYEQKCPNKHMSKTNSWWYMRDAPLAPMHVKIACTSSSHRFKDSGFYLNPLTKHIPLAGLMHLKSLIIYEHSTY